MRPIVIWGVCMHCLHRIWFARARNWDPLTGMYVEHRQCRDAVTRAVANRDHEWTRLQQAWRAERQLLDGRLADAQAAQSWAQHNGYQEWQREQEDRERALQAEQERYASARADSAVIFEYGEPEAA